MASNDASNVTDLAVDAGVQAPSTSTSDVSNVLEASDAGQSSVGDDYFSSSVGNAEVAIVNEVKKTVSDKTLIFAVVAGGVCLVIAAMYFRKGGFLR